MVSPCVSKVLFISLFAVISGSATAQSLEMSRSDTAFQFSPPSAANAVSREFRSRTLFLIDFGIGSEEPGFEALEMLGEQAGWTIGHHDHIPLKTDRIEASKRVAALSQTSKSGVLQGKGGKQDIS